MLEAVRQYATARLEENSEVDEARRRHFEYFANWAHGPTTGSRSYVSRTRSWRG